MIGLAAAGLLLGLAGCQTVPQSEYDAAIAENNELRSRRDDLVDRLNQSEADKLDLQRNNTQLAQENLRLQGQLNQQPQQAAPGGFQMRAGEEAVVTLASDVLFASGKADLTSQGKSRLNEIASVIQSQYAGMGVRVEGYTDSDPIRKSGWKTNERLSAERAMSVEAYLVTRGIPADRIYSAAMGSANRKNTKAASRRVEIVIVTRG
ncbi:MAG: OmpA family protein [Planctomycetota bacterium]